MPLSFKVDRSSPRLISIRYPCYGLCESIVLGMSARALESGRLTSSPWLTLMFKHFFNDGDQQVWRLGMQDRNVRFSFMYTYNYFRSHFDMEAYTLPGVLLSVGTRSNASVYNS